MTDFSGLLGENEKNSITEGVANVLRQIGVQCSHPKTLDRMAAVAGVRVDGDRLLFSRNALFEHIERIRARPSAKDGGFGLFGPWCSFEICDPHINEVRLPSEQDVVDATKLIGSITNGSGPFGGPVPLYLPHVPPRL